MKSSKLFAAMLVASLAVASVADAASFGRSGGGGSSSRSSTSSSSFSRPSSPSPAPSYSKPSAAPATSNGIGGTSGSMGVRKSDVTAPVAAQVRPAPTPNTSPSYSSPPTPSYGTVPAPVYTSPAPSNSSTFWSSMGGSFAGTMLGNALFSNHGSHGGGTTVINNGTPSGGAVVAGPSSSFDSGVVSGPGSFSQPAKKEYTLWSFIGDLIAFVFLVALLVGIAWLFYKGFKMIRDYVNRERGVSPTQPFNPTQKFWEVQNAFSAADEAKLRTLLGPDLVDEATRDLQPVTLALSNVSHEVRLFNPSEFSIWYTFTDDGQEVNQVWHYEKFGKDWLLNGIETV